MTQIRRRPGWATGATDHESTTGSSGYCDHSPIGRQLRRRRTASWRCAPLDSGPRDPWVPWRPEQPSEQLIDGYRDAVEHLLALDLGPHPFIPELRALWRRGGTDRALAERVHERGVTA